MMFFTLVKGYTPFARREETMLVEDINGDVLGARRHDFFLEFGRELRPANPWPDNPSTMSTVTLPPFTAMFFTALADTNPSPDADR